MPAGVSGRAEPSCSAPSRRPTPCGRPWSNRFQAYAIEVLPETRAYMEAVMALPAWQSWVAGAKVEPWRIDRYDAL